MTEWQSDCIHFEYEQDTDGYGRYIAPPVCYCSKGHQECMDCKDYEKWWCGMTVKRYYNIIPNGIEDTVDNRIIRGSAIGDELNRLSDENEQLKNSGQYWYDEHKRIVNNYVDKIKEVEKENKQLKQLVNIADDLIDELGSETMQNEWIKNF